MDKDTKIVLEALETLRNGGGLQPCHTALAWLKQFSAKEIYNNHNVDDWIEWLGDALVHAGCINPPKGPSKEGMVVLGKWGPFLAYARWYYPYKVLIEGCKYWLKKQKKTGRKKT